MKPRIRTSRSTDEKSLKQNYELRKQNVTIDQKIEDISHYIGLLRTQYDTRKITSAREATKRYR